MIMRFIEVVGSPVLLVGGVATLGWGWLPTWERSSVRRPVAFGWAQLTLSAALITCLISDSLTSAPHLGLAVKMVGIVVMLFGFWLFDVAERKPQHL
ncbi:hypothetical protein [Streptomyces sasae]|uniref:hypothetical protein n=1 Tax=Streptomyces sasae TaxID=1266772 RepID=UPI00292E24DB|nr:hypothetical protein [Streptomyces sasae]